MNQMNCHQGAYNLERKTRQSIYNCNTWWKVVHSMNKGFDLCFGDSKIRSLLSHNELKIIHMKMLIPCFKNISDCPVFSLKCYHISICVYFEKGLYWKYHVNNITDFKFILYLFHGKFQDVLNMVILYSNDSELCGLLQMPIEV